MNQKRKDEADLTPEGRIAAVMRMKLSPRGDDGEPWFAGWNAAVEEMRRVLAYPGEPDPPQYDE